VNHKEFPCLQAFAFENWRTFHEQDDEDSQVKEEQGVAPQIPGDIDVGGRRDRVGSMRGCGADTYRRAAPNSDAHATANG
jgi:hypothetical protein